MLSKENSNSNHCLFSELPTASLRVQHTRACGCRLAAHPLEFEVSRCRTSQFAMCFLYAKTRVWNDLPYTVFDTRTLDGFKGAVNRWLFPWVFFQFFIVQVHVGLRKQFINNFVFPTWACADGFNNSNIKLSPSVSPFISSKPHLCLLSLVYLLNVTLISFNYIFTLPSCIYIHQPSFISSKLQ